MKTILDQYFGEMQFNMFWHRPYKICIFASEKSTTLVVQTFDDDEITDSQRLTFEYFERNQQRIIAEVERGILIYYKSTFNSKVSTVSEVSSLVELLAIKIMYSNVDDIQEIGFVFDASFDPELGIGVLVANGKVQAVDVQDIVLG